jgi:hypothetical protein
MRNFIDDYLLFFFFCSIYSGNIAGAFIRSRFDITALANYGGDSLKRTKN